MEYRPLEITVVSADDLKDVNLITKMDVYVAVSISGDPKSERKTPVDKDGGKYPRWNHRITFSVDATAVASQPNLCLLFKLKSQRPFGDRIIGDVAVPIKELLDNNNNNNHSDGGGSERFVNYQVRTSSGKPKGTLRFSYKFGEKFTTTISKYADEHVTAYPPPHAGASTAYPPPQGVGYAPPPPPGMGTPYPQAGYPPQPVHGYGGYPPQPGYGGGYPPAAATYGYPPVMQQQQQQQQQGKRRKNGLGLGLGAGLLGGLLVGDMISDAGEMNGYDDAGFDDAGFDF